MLGGTETFFDPSIGITPVRDDPRVEHPNGPCAGGRRPRRSSAVSPRRPVPTVIAKSRQRGAAASSLEEPLTQRELEVLGLMAGGKTNREIAEGLSISDSAARSCVRRVRVKLGASDRNQAVARARVLGLAPVPKTVP